MKNVRLFILIILSLLVCFGERVNAIVIDFETFPDGTPSIDNTPLGLTDAYVVDGVSVTFGFDTDGDDVTDTEAIFELTGGSDGVGHGNGGFSNDQLGGLSGVADPGFETQLGNFFLRRAGNSLNFDSFIIDYNSTDPVVAASGEIWDIDGWGGLTEQYKVEAFDSSYALLDTILSPLGSDSSLDGRPWTFGFSGLSDIARIKISFVSHLWAIRSQGSGWRLTTSHLQRMRTILRPYRNLARCSSSAPV